MKTASTDRLLLAGFQELMKVVNMDDLQVRESAHIESAYHKDWFYQHDESTYFFPPTAYIKEGTIFFINGRHRTILLGRYLRTIPFLISGLDQDYIGMKPKHESLRVLKTITVSQLEEHSSVYLPDLGYGDFSPA